MSAAESEPGDGDDVEGPETPETPDDETPTLADDEKATLPADLADLAADVEAETGAASAEPDESDEGGQQATADAETGEESTDAPDALSGQSEATDGPTWGDQYVTVLAVVLGAIVEEHGGDDAEVDQEHIANLATQHPIRLNEQADRVFAEMNGTEEMDPKQALIVSTAILVGTVLLAETDVASQALSSLGEGGLGGLSMPGSGSTPADADAEEGETA